MYFMTFTADLKKWTNKTNVFVVEIIRESAADLFEEIIHRTPVGDPSLWKSKPPADYIPGNLQSNWQCTLGTPASGMWSFEDKSAEQTISAMKSVIEGSLPDQPIFLTNLLPYAARIEYGAHSTQAPHGMVRVSIATFEQTFNKAVAKVAA